MVSARCVALADGTCALRTTPSPLRHTYQEGPGFLSSRHEVAGLRDRRFERDPPHRGAPVAATWNDPAATAGLGERIVIVVRLLT